MVKKSFKRSDLVHEAMSFFKIYCERYYNRDSDYYMDSRMYLKCIDLVGFLYALDVFNFDKYMLLYSILDRKFAIKWGRHRFGGGYPQNI